MEADVVVIGAGAAGMAAARKLAGRSRRVVVLEARDRIGSGPALVTAVIEMRVLSLLRTAVRSVLDAVAGAQRARRRMGRRPAGDRARRPDAEELTWCQILPFLAYAAFVAGAIALPLAPVEALFALAAGVLLLIFIGIHNAWDIVTFIVIKDGAQALASTSPAFSRPDASSNDDAAATAPDGATSAGDEPVTRA